MVCIKKTSNGLEAQRNENQTNNKIKGCNKQTKGCGAQLALGHEVKPNSPSLTPSVGVRKK